MHLEEMLFSESFWNAPVEFYVCHSKIITMLYVIQYSNIEYSDQYSDETMSAFPLSYCPSTSLLGHLSGSDLSATDSLRHSQVKQMTMFIVSAKPRPYSFILQWSEPQGQANRKLLWSHLEQLCSCPRGTCLCRDVLPGARPGVCSVLGSQAL